MNGKRPLKSEISTIINKIMRSYATGNDLSFRDFPELAGNIHAQLQCLSVQGEGGPEERGRRLPAVSIGKSVLPGCLVCLEDGLRFKSLKRHLRGRHDLTPDGYRARWDLPANYPMMAFGLFAVRSRTCRRWHNRFEPSHLD
jgi:predicted transcriptional regulator